MGVWLVALEEDMREADIVNLDVVFTRHGGINHAYFASLSSATSYIFCFLFCEAGLGLCCKCTDFLNVKSNLLICLSQDVVSVSSKLVL